MSDPLRDLNIARSASLSKEAKFWVNELDLASKREKKWRKKAEEVWKLYEGAKRAENSFNILYANTETLLPACYNQLPRPLVDRRFKDPDPIGKAAGETLQRTLSYLMDSPEQKYSSFSDIIEQAVLSALVPGRGVTRFRYEPEFEDSENAVGDEDEDAGETDDSGSGDEPPEADVSDESGESAALFPSTEGKKVAYETICGEDIAYDNLLLGYSRRWIDTPWIAFYHAMTKEDLEVNFGKEIAEKIPTAPPGELDEDGYRKATSDEDGEKNLGSIPTADIYEIWHKATKTVIFFGVQYDDKVIKTIEDPLKLSGFYPIPPPLVFLRKGTEQVPVPIYTMYEEQAKELNLLSKRITKVASAIKVRGFYDKTIQGIEDLLKKDDNTLIPATNVPALQQGQSLDKAIWLMPIEDLMQVLKELLNAREACKATIYEITGIADLMRGDTQASETATAQTIKDRWGSLRVRRFQRYVQEYVRDCLRIMGELAGQQFAPETFAAITGLDYATDEQVQQAQQMMQMAQQMMMQQPPPPPEPPQGMPPGPEQGPGGEPLPGPGGPPGQPPAPPPEVQQMLQQAQEILNKPKWSDVVATLQSDLQRGYKIDIETNSTIEATSQEDKQNLNEAVQALASGYQSFLPAVQAGAMTMPTLKGIIGATVRRFEFGKVVEDAVAAMPDEMPPPPEDPAQKKQMEAQAQQLMQQQKELEKAKMALDAQKAQLDLQKQQMQMKEQLMMEKMKMKEQQMKDRIALTQEKHLMQVQGSMDKQAAALEKNISQAAAERDNALQEHANNIKMAAKEQQMRDKMQQQRHKEMVGTMQQGHKGMADNMKVLADLVSRPQPKRTITPLRGPDGKIASISVE